MAKENAAVRKFVLRARNAIEEGDDQAAVSELEKGLSMYPESPKLLFELGYLHYEAGEREKCVELLTKAIALSPLGNCRVYFTLSELVPPGQAIELTSRGLEVGQAHYTQLEHELKSLEAGLAPRRAKLLEKICALRRVLAQGNYRLAELRAVACSDWSASWELLERATAIDRAYLEPYYRMMMLAFNQDKMEEFDHIGETLATIVKELEEADDDELEEYPAEFFNDVTRLLVEADRPSLASKWADIVVSLHPRDFFAVYLFAFTLTKAGNFAEAASALEELDALHVLDSEDPELIDGFNELRAEVARHLPAEDWQEE